MRILYIEDNAANLALVERVVQMRSDDLETYASAEEALEHCDIASFDLIITDIHLGEDVMDGLDFTAYLRKHGVEIPIISLTAYDFQDYERRSAEAGSDAYVVKPIAPQKLLDILDQYRTD